jgi:serine/threonine-protein kinase
MQDLIGRNIGPYQIVDRLGQGGMASVYKAVQGSLNRSVALKILPPTLALDPTFVERFRREANAAASMQHPNILPIYDFGQAGDIFYIAMMLVLGGTLRERIGRLPMSLTARLASQIADALDYAHQRGIIHRDIKPTNILMARDDWAMLSDFGIARIVEAQGLTSTGTGIGTPEYMSPEQALGRPVDGRSDIYSLGVVLYEMATGRQPFTGPDSFSVVRQHIDTPIPAPSAMNAAVPPAIDAIVAKATQKDPNLRYQTAGEMKAALDRFAGGGATAGATAPFAAAATQVAAPSRGGTPPPPPPAGDAPPARGGRPPWLIIGGIVAALALCVCVGGGGAIAFASGLLNGPTPTPTTMVMSTSTPTRPAGSSTPGRTATPGAPATPTRPPTTPTRAVPTTVPVGNLVFSDDFSSNRNGWDVVDNSNVTSYFQNNQFHVENHYTTNTNWQTTPRNNRTQYASMAYEVDMIKLDGPDDKSYGIGFRIAGLDGYDFFIRGNGSYSLGHYSEALQRSGQDGYDFLIEPTQAPAGIINLGNAKNRLKVVARGPQIVLYVNDRYLNEVQATKREFQTTGTIALVVGQDLHVDFTAVRLFEVR